MSVPLRTKIRAMRWFPLLSGEQIKECFPLIREIIPLPSGPSEAIQALYKPKFSKLCALMDIPPDIRIHFGETYRFFRALYALMLLKEKFDALALGMRVSVYDRTGVIARLDQRALCATVRYEGFVHSFEKISVGEVHPLYSKKREK